jgi:hypothetical protein
MKALVVFMPCEYEERKKKAVSVTAQGLPLFLNIFCAESSSLKMLPDWREV